ncbi:MAG: hypothetical protein L3K26_15960, partial [Candidatus Hydrogenedentes bacterium]|nr:hypothetical protein [Candidatus Hydrogenedentota bacterium]
MWERIEFVEQMGSADRCARLLGVVLAIGLLSGCYREYRDSNVQSFGPGEAAVLDGKQLYFTYSRRSFDAALTSNETKITPIWGEPPYYYRAVSEQTEFLVDPADHESIDFSVSDPFIIPENTIGTSISSDGTISFGQPGLGNGNLAEFLRPPQVSL